MSAVWGKNLELTIFGESDGQAIGIVYSKFAGWNCFGLMKLKET